MECLETLLFWRSGIKRFRISTTKLKEYPVKVSYGVVSTGLLSM
jgi:hypothetical protein